MSKRGKNSSGNKPTTRKTSAVVQQNLAEKDQRVAVAAYFKAEKRHFETGHELDDWFEAKAELEEVS